MFGKRECATIESLLWGYAACRLSEADRERVERHLIVCVSCAKQAAAYDSTVGLVAAFREKTVPASCATWQELRAQLESSEPPVLRVFDPSRRLLSLAWGGAGLAAAAVALLAVTSWHRPLISRPLSASSSTAHRVVPNASSVTARRPAELSAPVKLTGMDSALEAEEQAQASRLRMTPNLNRMPARRPEGSPRPHVFTKRHLTRMKTARKAGVGTDTPLPGTPVAMFTLSVDGDRPVSAEARRDYVIATVVPNQDAPRSPSYVIGGVPVFTPTTLAASLDPNNEELKAW